MVKSCENCSQSFDSDAPTSRFCSAKCRKAAWKAGKDTVPAASERSGTAGTAAEACRRELEAAGRLDTYLGATALRLAERIDNSTAVMGFAALAKELRATMDAALEGVKRGSDRLDELRARRDRKAAAGG